MGAWHDPVHLLPVHGGCQPDHLSAADVLHARAELSRIITLTGELYGVVVLLPEDRHLVESLQPAYRCRRGQRLGQSTFCLLLRNLLLGVGGEQSCQADEVNCHCEQSFFSENSSRYCNINIRM